MTPRAMLCLHAPCVTGAGDVHEELWPHVSREATFLGDVGGAAQGGHPKAQGGGAAAAVLHILTRLF